MAFIPGLLASKMLGPLIAGAVVFGTGFTAAEVYEHKIPWGLAHQRDKLRDSIPGVKAAAYKDGAGAQAKADQDGFNKWSAALTACEAKGVAGRDADASALTQLQKFGSTQAAQAYKLGRASCEPSHAQVSPSGGHAAPAGVPAPRDVRTIVSGGAYTPTP